jgi:hypothetical protein
MAAHRRDQVAVLGIVTLSAMSGADRDGGENAVESGAAGGTRSQPFGARSPNVKLTVGASSRRGVLPSSVRSSTSRKPVVPRHPSPAV